MNLNLILIAIIAGILSIGGAAVGGYQKGKFDAALKAKDAMGAHLAKDAKAEATAIKGAQDAKDKLATAQNAVGAAYEKGKRDAETSAKRVVADLRTGNLLLRDRWTACKTSAGLPETPTSSSEPDAGTSDRADSAGRIIQAAASCDAQVKGLQEILRLEREQDAQTPQPVVGAHVGPLPD